MFAKARFLSFLVLTLAASSWFFACALVRSSDIALMAQKIEQQAKNSSNQLFSTTEQERKGVLKEIWLTQEDNSRLHYRIFSASSLLTIQPKGKSFDLIEKLHNMQCWMQERLYKQEGDMQQIRLLKADEGVYRFSTQQFLAQSVGVGLYRLNGHELPQDMSEQKPFLKGIASDISFAIGGKNPQFRAENFKAELGGKK